MSEAAILVILTAAGVSVTGFIGMYLDKSWHIKKPEAHWAIGVPALLPAFVYAIFILSTRAGG